MPLKSIMGGVIDAHIHLVNFMQEGEGVQKLLQKMDYAGIEKSVIFGLPVTKRWADDDSVAPVRPFDDDTRLYYYSYTDQLVLNELSSLPKEEKERFAPLICGFNPTDRLAIRHVERLFAESPHFWKGIGEVLLRHSYITHLIEGEAPRPNSPAMYPIYEFAASKNLPVLLHQDISNVPNRDQPVFLHELEEALQNFPGTVFVWAHCGTTPEIWIYNHSKEIERLLTTYSNLFCDISWSLFEDLLYRNHVISQHWLKLLQNYSDRFCLGSDLTGRFDGLSHEIHKYRVIIEHLNSTARQNILHNVAESIYFKR